MKHIISVVFFIAYDTPSFAQFSKGDKALSGSLSLKIEQDPVSSNVSSTRETTVGFYPSFGVFVNKNLEIGALFGYSSSSAESEYSRSAQSSSHGFVAGLYGSKYFQITEKFFFSFLGKAEHHSTKRFSKDPDQDGQTFSRDVKVNFSPHLVFFPASNWALTANLGGAGYSYHVSNNYSSHVFSIDIGQNFGFGFSYYFRK